MVATRVWANQPAKRGRQKPKPRGDRRDWEARAEYHVKRVANFRRAVRNSVKTILVESDWTMRQGSASTAEQQLDVSVKLYYVFRRLYYLETHGIMIERPAGKPEYQIHMTRQQIARNAQLRKEEGAPPFEVWFDRAVAPEHSATATAPAPPPQPQPPPGQNMFTSAKSRPEERPRPQSPPLTPPPPLMPPPRPRTAIRRGMAHGA